LAPFLSRAGLPPTAASLERKLPRSVPQLLLADAELGEKFAQDRVIYWLDQMRVKARFLGRAAVLVLPPSRQGYQQRATKDFRGWPLQHSVSELTDAAHPARAIAHGQREWFAERFREWTTAAGVKDPKATARALVVLFDGAVAGSEVDGPQRASDARWMASCWPA
jgi:hypothetical protein